MVYIRILNLNVALFGTWYFNISSSCIYAHPCLFIYKNLQAYSILITLLCAVGRRKRRKSKLLTHKEARCNLLEAWISCASVDCLHPHNKQNVVSWVQCDDCNAWYHVKCTGLTLKSVKPKTAKFHCGCVWEEAAPEKQRVWFLYFIHHHHTSLWPSFIVQASC